MLTPLALTVNFLLGLDSEARRTLYDATAVAISLDDFESSFAFLHLPAWSLLV